MSLIGQLQKSGVALSDEAIAAKLAEYGYGDESVLDAAKVAALAAKLSGEKLAIAPATQQNPTTRGRKPGRKPGNQDGMKLALKKPAEEMLAFGQGIESMAEQAEDSQVDYLVDRVHAMPGNVRDKFVVAMAEVEVDPESFRQDAEQIFESLFDVSQFALG